MSDSQKNETKEELNALADVMTVRYKIAGLMGQSFSGNRDIYAECGYPSSISFKDYKDRFDRGDIAKVIVSAFPDATWVDGIEIVDSINKDEDKQSDFVQNLEKLNKHIPMMSYCYRADLLAGIGDYSIIVMGFDDEASNENQLQTGKASRLLYMKPFEQGSVDIVEWDEDPKSERFGKPIRYEVGIDLTHDPKTTGKQLKKKIHYSRVIHIADNCLESDVFGVPRMQQVWNRLQDLETVISGSAECYWRFGFPGYNFKKDPDVPFITDTGDLKQKMRDFVHGLSRFLTLEGISIEQLQGETADPTAQVKVELWMISAATGIPMRKIIGSESGELASTEDQRNWSKKVKERNFQFAEPRILRPVIDKLIEAGVIASPEGGYDIKWPDVYEETMSEKADAAQGFATALKAYASVPNAAFVVPPHKFRTKYMSISEKESMNIEEAVEKEMEHDRTIEEGAESRALRPEGLQPEGQGEKGKVAQREP